MKKLKPCPLCGNQAQAFEATEGRMANVCCMSPVICGVKIVGFYLDEIVERWNTRYHEGRQL